MGWISQDDIAKGYVKMSHANIQSKWSEYLGNLMYYPSLPLAIFSTL